ncbi:MAG: alpha-galactosidase [Alphaproteobacteria bacterium]|nr:alpha-galactosidase [Alphaproteobacteria bacterium]MDA8003888.1 alpha-galactosidase [Alphaproteobacteria bacterium]MDA8005915.1 alpha-galactosidase [Alphaproteobacteria bacterium]MDA8013278.1 alpha-galactosidase [Alphaproteobacteria bacterium]
MMRVWRLDDGVQTLVLGSRDDCLAEVVYWGAPLSLDSDLHALFDAVVMETAPGGLDLVPELSICPELSRSFPGQCGFIGRFAGNNGDAVRRHNNIDNDGDGDNNGAADGRRLIINDNNGADIRRHNNTDNDNDGDGDNNAPPLSSNRPLLSKFSFVSDKIDDNRLELVFADKSAGLTYRASFLIDTETHIIETQAAIESEQPLLLHWLAAPAFPAPQSSDEMLDFSGHWCGEFQLQRTKWTPGVRLRENPTGRSGHEHFPALIVPCRGAVNNAGGAYAFHYGWSGGHRMIAEELPDGRRQIQFGNAANSEHRPRKQFATATLYTAFSPNGLNGCAVAFQRHLRERVLPMSGGARPRPVHYNTWEAIGFRHDMNTLKELADTAADLGAERFVLDDGWFKGRDNDSRALGDWYVDERKYPDGLAPLIQHVRALGMTFGLWFEPEMVSPDSDLHRQHPDWTLGDDTQILGRHQMVLNLALPEVREYLLARIAALLSEHDIEYIKWDHNRVLPFADAAQTRATYTLLDDLRRAFPNVEIETCAAGGARIDFGILQRARRVWLSDSNDALERLKMQHNAALFLPMTVTGSHVGPRVCHTSGRTHDIRFRAWVAAQRSMGIEMDPRELADDEAAVLREVIKWWKANRDWLAAADILRLDSDDPAVIAELHLARDGKRFVVFAGRAAPSMQSAPRPLRLAGLAPDTSYKVELINRADTPKLSRGDPHIKTKPLVAAGAFLTHHGVALPWNFPETMQVLEGTAQ